MDISIVKELVSIMEASSLTSMEVELSGQRVKLAREVKYAQNQMPSSVPVDVKTQPVKEAVADKIETKEKAQEDTAPKAAPAAGQKQVVAPMVGIFRSLESVGKGEAVVPGTEVKKGQTVCLIEAMKLLIEIEIEEDGVIVERLVEDGEMVEYGQPLFSYK